MVTVLMVAEKPSLAESIAKILSNNHMKTRRGIATNVHEFNGMLFGKPAYFKMTSVMGHVYSLDFPREYNNWNTVDPITLFEAPTIQLEANPKTHLIKHLRAESKGIDYLILWLDCDREGENICFEVMRNVMINIKPQPGKSKKESIYRARFSAITTPDVKRAMANLVRPNENDAKAVDVRQELDLKIGCCFTRFQTRYFQGKYGNLDSKTISYGPCQIPTLALCVKRHDEIMAFKPVPYWTLFLTININGTIVRANSTRGRIFDRNKVEGIKKSLKNLTVAKIYEISTDKKVVSRPHPLNTVELLRAASVGLGMSPQETMSIAERLYMQGYISYPRTETTKFPENFDIHSVLEEHKNHYIWGTYVNNLLVNGFKKPEGGIDAGDHSPITPTRVATEKNLGHNEWRLYELVTRTFIGSLLPNMKYLKTDITFEIGYETFTCSGKQIIDPGFSSVMHWRSQQDENLPMIDKEATYPVVEINSNESETTPPDYLSEADLLGLMEKYGIGTDASMAVHIASICNRNYVDVQGNRRSLIPTRLGIVLIHGYQKIDPELALPTMRAAMEKRIGLIAEGRAQFDSVLQDEIELYRSKFEWFVKKITNMDELFEATFSPLSSSGRPFSKCGKCRRYMHLIALKPTRLHCRHCNDTYALPNNGSIKLYNEIICPLDNFEVISYSNGTKGKGYPLCPYCYNNSPIESVDLMSCNKCTNPNCQLSLQNNGLFECPEDNCEGTMVLDNTLAPRYKIACNRCNLISCFNPEVHKVKLTDELCDECAGKKVCIEFIKKEGREPIIGCAICNDEINALLETKMDKIKHMNKRHKKYGKKGKKTKVKNGNTPDKEDDNEKSKPLYKRPETGYTLSLEALSSMGFTVDNINTPNNNKRETYGRFGRIENTRPSSNYSLFNTIQSKLDELSEKDTKPQTRTTAPSSSGMQIKFVSNSKPSTAPAPTTTSTTSSSGMQIKFVSNSKPSTIPTPVTTTTSTTISSSGMQIKFVSNNNNSNNNNNNYNNNKTSPSSTTITTPNESRSNSNNKLSKPTPNHDTKNNRNNNNSSYNNNYKYNSNNTKNTNNNNIKNINNPKNNTKNNNYNNNNNNNNNNNSSRNSNTTSKNNSSSSLNSMTTTTTTTSSGLKIKLVTKSTQSSTSSNTSINNNMSKSSSKININKNKNNNNNNNNNNNKSGGINNTNNNNKFNSKSSNNSNSNSNNNKFNDKSGNKSNKNSNLQNDIPNKENYHPKQNNNNNNNNNNKIYMNRPNSNNNNNNNNYSNYNNNNFNNNHEKVMNNNHQYNNNNNNRPNNSKSFNSNINNNNPNTNINNNNYNNNHPMKGRPNSYNGNMNKIYNKQQQPPSNFNRPNSYNDDYIMNNMVPAAVMVPGGMISNPYLPMGPPPPSVSHPSYGGYGSGPQAGGPPPHYFNNGPSLNRKRGGSSGRGRGRGSHY